MASAAHVLTVRAEQFEPVGGEFVIVTDVDESETGAFLFAHNPLQMLDQKVGVMVAESRPLQTQFVPRLPFVRDPELEHIAERRHSERVAEVAARQREHVAVEMYEVTKETRVIGRCLIEHLRQHHLEGQAIH